MNPQDSHAGYQPQALPPVIKTGLPGWIASAALHLLLVLLLASTWSGPAAVSIPTEDRPVAIVLVTRNDHERTTYFHETNVQRADIVDPHDLGDILPTIEEARIEALAQPVALTPSVLPASLLDQGSLGNLDLSGAGGRKHPWPNAPADVVIDEQDVDSAADLGEPARPKIFGIQAEGRSFVSRRWAASVSCDDVASVQHFTQFQLQFSPLSLLRTIVKGNPIEFWRHAVPRRPV